MKARKPLFLLALVALVAPLALPGCYEKVVRDDSVESRLGRATGQPTATKTEPVKEKSSWWPW